jgi:vacuolar-type H+-ATPase subunit H
LEKQLTDAEVKKEQMIVEAQRESVKLLRDGELLLEKKMQQRITLARRSLQKEKERIIQDKSKDIDLIRANAEENFNKAIPIILDIFERAINAETTTDE